MRILGTFCTGALRRSVVAAGCALVVAASVVLPNAALAVPIQWTLQGVTFDDGTTARGSFFYDADTNLYSDINITSSSGNVYGTRALNRSASAFGFFAIAAGGPPLIGDSLFFLIFTRQLSNAGGIVPFRGNSAYEGVCVNDGCGAAEIARVVTAGQVFAGSPVTLSEPGTLAIMGLGLAGLGLALRRRVKRT